MVNRISVLLAIYFAVGALAATCKTDGDHAATCANDKCEVIGQTEVCTQCKAGGVPIDGFCRPSASPQAITAGCTADASAGVCKACSGEFFLFMGGCYNTRAAPGSGVCREARDGACVRRAEGVRAKRAGAGETQDPSTGCQAVSSGGAGTCEQCEAPIGGTTYCSKCNDPSNYAPVDGVCVAVETEAGKKSLCTTHSDGVCTECGSTSFLYKGGCYQPGDGKPGQSLCVLAAKGVCTQAADGYFIPTGAANNEQSVVACNDDTTGVTVTADGNTYKGIAGCQECAAPAAAIGARADKVATCTRCVDPKYLKDNACVDSADDCGQGLFGKPDTDEGNRCVSCTDKTDGVTDCETCEYNMAASKVECTKCTGDNYLKTTADRTTTCEADCGDGYFGHTATNDGLKTCQSCSGENTGLTPAAAGVDGCAACTYSDKVTCTKCEAGKYLKTVADSTSCVETSGCGPTAFPKDDSTNGNKCAACNTVSDGGIEDCSECSLLPSASRAGAILITCTKCTGKKLSPLKDACLDSCPAGTYDNNNVCTPCHTSCSSCSDAGESSCTACYPGHVLNKTDSLNTGTCIPECTGRYAENCETGMCTAVLGGSKYCSKCKSGFVPVDGLCVSAGTTRAAPAGCTPSTTTAGTCESCKDAYFLESGGCYLSTAYPGSTLCSSAADGQCSQCANGQTQSNGSCPACDPTCATCETGKPQECKTCFSGYYLDSTAKTCKKCSETSGNIQGVENCVSCLAPTSPSTPTPVLCYVTQEPAVDPTDPSINKGGLSSGAIAGISIAVIAVVGGLVGFLCWWFICRGKA